MATGSSDQTFGRIEQALGRLDAAWTLGKAGGAPADAAEGANDPGLCARYEALRAAVREAIVEIDALIAGIKP